METIDQRIAEFEASIRSIILQFKQMNAALVENPHMNLGPHDMGLVEILGESGPQMMRVIAEKLGLAVNSLTPIVDSLEQRGLVQRLRSETDRRVINLVLSDEGIRAYQAAKQLKDEFHRTMLRALNTEEQRTFLDLFKKIAMAGAKSVETLKHMESPSNSIVHYAE